MLIRFKSYGGGFLIVSLISVSISLVAAGAVGVGSADAALSVSVKAAKKKITLGSGVKMKIEINGASTTDTYQIEESPFPYTSWVAAGVPSAIPSPSFERVVKPRVNTRFRISIASGAQTVKSSSRPLVYVDPVERNRYKARRGRVVVRYKEVFDSSMGAAWKKVPRKDKFIYFFRACGTTAGPTTPYRIYTKIPVRAKTSGDRTTLSAGKTVRVGCSSFPSYWFGFWFDVTLPKVLNNGDDGYGEPDFPKRDLVLRNRLKLKKVLTKKQIQKLTRR